MTWPRFWYRFWCCFTIAALVFTVVSPVFDFVSFPVWLLGVLVTIFGMYEVINHGEPAPWLFEAGWRPMQREEFRDFIERNNELKALYAELGYSPYVERKSEELIDGLKALLRTEIPDFAAFRRALATIQRVHQGRPEKDSNDDLLFEAEDTDPKEPLTVEATLQMQEDIWIDHAASLMKGDSRLDVLIAAQDDRGKLLEILNKNPLYSANLPFHFYYSLFRTRPTNPARFAQLLDELESLFESRWIPQSLEVRRKVLNEIAEVKRYFKEDNSLSHSVQCLIYGVDSACVHPDDETLQEKKRQLDNLLRDLYVRRKYGPDYPFFEETVQQQTKRYLDNPWMHTPWLTTYVLTNLLDAELDSLTWKAMVSPGGFGPVIVGPYCALLPKLGWFVGSLGAAGLGWYYFKRLRLICSLRPVREEVASGYYDGEEIAHRLRRYGEKGLYVHSLTYSLLRLKT